MPDAEDIAARPPLQVHIKSDKAVRLRVGTRWEVVASTPDSLWDGSYKVTLREIVAAREEE